MTQTYILDFEAYQIDGKFYPVEIALVNCQTKKFQVFHIAYPEMRNLPLLAQLPFLDAIDWQLRRHGIPFDAPFARYCLCTVKTLNEYIVHGDTVLVKGLQKVLYFRDWFPKCVNVQQLDDHPKIETLIQQLKNASSDHVVSQNRCLAVHSKPAAVDKFCALEKCFAILHHHVSPW